MMNPQSSGPQALVLLAILVAGLATLLATPDAGLRASACGEHGINICRTTTTCVWVLKDPCSTEYEYYSKKNAEDEEEGDEESETPEEEEVVE